MLVVWTAKPCTNSGRRLKQLSWALIVATSFRGAHPCWPAQAKLADQRVASNMLHKFNTAKCHGSWNAFSMRSHKTNLPILSALLWCNVCKNCKSFNAFLCDSQRSRESQQETRTKQKRSIQSIVCACPLTVVERSACRSFLDLFGALGLGCLPPNRPVKLVSPPSTQLPLISSASTAGTILTWLKSLHLLLARL